MFEYVPFVHAEHIPDPFTALDVPSLQAVHGPPSHPSYPMLQMQSTTLSLPISEVVFAGHTRHAEAAATSEYVPFVHAEHIPDPFTALDVPFLQDIHGPPSHPSYPMLQMQFITLPLPISEWVLAGHFRHAEAAVTFE